MYRSDGQQSHVPGFKPRAEFNRIPANVYPMRCIRGLLILAIFIGGPLFAGIPHPPGAMSPMEMNRLMTGRDSQSSTTIDVISYTIDIDIVFDTESVSAVCHVGLAALENNLSPFILDFVGMDVTNVIENGTVTVSWDQSDTALTITPSTPLSLGEERVYSIAYGGTPLSGLHFGAENGGVCWTFTEPERSRHWYPCRDVPEDRADWYRGNITVPSEFQVASNGDLVGVDDNGNGTSTWHYFHDYPIATYLISLAISAYDTFTQETAGGLPIKHYVYPAKLEAAEFDWANIPWMIDFYSDTYYPYPYPTFGHAMAPPGSTIEHQTMVTFESSLVNGSRAWEWVVAHELAHQWWGNMIGCHGWVNIWLNEGFASYFDALFYQAYYGEERFRDWMTGRRDAYFSHETANGKYPLYDPDYWFGLTVYYKGSWVLHMMRRMVGDEIFADIMHEYASRHAYSTATTEDFIDAAEDVSGLDLDLFFEQWVYKAGYPIFFFDWNWEAGTLTVSIDQVQTLDELTPIFDVPVELRIVTSSGVTDEVVRVDEENEVFTFSISTRPNRVIFDPDLWLLCKVGGPSGVAAAPGPHMDNPCLVRTFDTFRNQLGPEIVPYGVDRYGANVGAADLNGNGIDAVLTGPGPGAVFGPHVRAFDVTGTPVSGVSFFAYGTPRWGVNVSGGDIDGDGYDEIITGAGPGSVYGPHVRAFDYDGGPTVTPISGISYFAYGTNRWGVNVASADIDGDGFDEILTGAGPGSVFGPHVRSWDVDGTGTAAADPRVSFMAYGTHRWGVNLTGGDIDGDGIDEIITGAGPGAVFGSHVRAFNYDGVSVTPMTEVSLFAFGYDYGAQVGVCDFDGDGADELIVAPGPDPDAPHKIHCYRLDESGELDFFAVINAFWDERYGGRLTGGRFVDGSRSSLSGGSGK